jgi:hypothetical protein
MIVKKYSPKYKKFSDIPEKKVNLKSTLTDWKKVKAELLGN